MSVIGLWRRSALGAGGVALLLPLGLALGVALTAALGGEARLRALGQVVAGPDAPERAQAPGLESSRDVPSVPVRRRAAAPAPAAPGTPAAPGPRETAPASPDSPVASPNEPERTPAEPGPAGPTPVAPAEPSPTPETPAGSPLHETAQGAADAVAQVPVVGAITDDAMQTVVDLIP